MKHLSKELEIITLIKEVEMGRKQITVNLSVTLEMDENIDTTYAAAQLKVLSDDADIKIDNVDVQDVN